MRENETKKTLPEAEGVIDRWLETKLRGKCPDEKEKKRLSDALLRRGFAWGEVKAAFGRLETELREETTWN